LLLIRLILLLVALYSTILSAHSQNIRIDHVITVVANLDSAITTFEDLGFTIKQGRLHDNGLLNAHIRFKDNTSLELMSIKGEPTDEVAKGYSELLKSGEGGVFLAITGISIDSMEAKLNDIRIGYNRIPGDNWDYITFPSNSSLAHIFFIEYHIKSSDSKEMLTHENSANGIEAVWIEGDDNVRKLLEGLGLLPVRLRSDNMLGSGQGYRSGICNIIVLPEKNPSQRPRIKALSIGKKDGSKSLIIRY
jgi:hypothetical protein